VPKTITLRLSTASYARLDILKAKTEAATYAEVVKNALRIYEALIEESETGKRFFMRDEAGGVTIFRVFV
jgi:predicted DNA-binding protein